MTSARDQIERQAEWESQLAGLIEPRVLRFLAGVVGDAVYALGAPVLLAAGRRRRDPFAFTNVMARWRLAVDLIAATPRSQIAHPALLDEVVMRALRAADIPHTAHSKAVEILTTSRDLEWTKAQTRRQIRAALIPATPPGRTASPDWSWWKARVRALARTAATRASSLAAFEEDTEATAKRWITQRDTHVREAHGIAHGQTVPREQPFKVGGYAMQYPGDDTAPPELTANCRCVLVLIP